jgi:hypothetical protein
MDSTIQADELHSYEEESGAGTILTADYGNPKNWSAMETSRSPSS